MDEFVFKKSVKFNVSNRSTGCDKNRQSWNQHRTSGQLDLGFFKANLKDSRCKKLAQIIEPNVNTLSKFPTDITRIGFNKKCQSRQRSDAGRHVEEPPTLRTDHFSGNLHLTNQIELKSSSNATHETNITPNWRTKSILNNKAPRRVNGR